MVLRRAAMAIGLTTAPQGDRAMKLLNLSKGRTLFNVQRCALALRIAAPASLTPRRVRSGLLRATQREIAIQTYEGELFSKRGRD